jgi:hypothetical protein
MRGDRCRWAAPLGFVLSIGRVAGADPAPTNLPARPTSLRVAYMVPGNCPPQADFEARVRDRTELARFVEDPEARNVRVVVRPTGFTYAGHLVIEDRSGTSERDVEDRECADVVDALALITALAVDPTALLAPRTATPSASPPPAPALALAPAPALALAPAPALAFAPALAPSPPRWSLSSGLSFLALLGIAPDALIGGGAFVDLEDGASGWFAPSFRLSGLATTNGAFDSPEASFSLAWGRADACPARLGSSSASLRACVGLDVGALFAEGRQAAIANPREVIDFWFSGAALLRGRWAPRGGWFFVEGEAGVMVPTTRHRFVFTIPMLLVHEASTVEGDFSLLAGVRFW